MGARFTIALPAPPDDFARWLEQHNGSVEISYALGSYQVNVGWRKVHSYSSVNGGHFEQWHITREGPTLPETLSRAMQCAMEISERGAER